MIQITCDDCHKSYQPLVTAIYRSAYCENIKIKDFSAGSQSFEDNMHALSTSVNQILIALGDGHKATALKTSQNLTDQLSQLQSSCSHCHKKDMYPVERILGGVTKNNLK